MSKKAPAFPPDCCGVCTFCHLEDKQFKCYEAPPRKDDVTLEVVRGLDIDPYAPVCRVFKLRSQD